MDKLLTQKDLAERWKVSIRAVENWRKEGKIIPIEGIPSIRFNPRQIEELEGTKLERFSPLERKCMERELEELKQENEKLRGILSKTLADLAPILNL